MKKLMQWLKTINEPADDRKNGTVPRSQKFSREEDYDNERSVSYGFLKREIERNRRTHVLYCMLSPNKRAWHKRAL